MAIAGVDVGTTGCKCTVCDSNGSLLSEAYQEYDIQKSDGRELDAWEVWTNVKAVIRQAVSKADRIHAIGVTSFGETTIFLGEDDKPLMNSLCRSQRGRAVQKIDQSFWERLSLSGNRN